MGGRASKLAYPPHFYLPNLRGNNFVETNVLSQWRACLYKKVCRCVPSSDERRLAKSHNIVLRYSSHLSHHNVTSKNRVYKWAIYQNHFLQSSYACPCLMHSSHFFCQANLQGQRSIIKDRETQRKSLVVIRNMFWDIDHFGSSNKYKQGQADACAYKTLQSDIQQSASQVFCQWNNFCNLVVLKIIIRFSN